MNIILDSNIIFSSLIKNSTTRKLILKNKELFILPEFVFEELNKHKSELLLKTRIASDEFQELFQSIISDINIVPKKYSDEHMLEAIRIVKDIDMGDASFIACALLYPDSIIWSDDKALKKQKEVKVLNTKEIIELLSRK
ncbi:MAG: PIN domain-containing protein [Candidatus Nanoarchaeia archaeon]